MATIPSGTIAVGGDIEKRDHVTAGLSGFESGIERLPCPQIGMGGEQGVAVDQIAYGARLAPQVADDVPEVDAVPASGMLDADPGGGHHPVGPKKELDAVVMEMGVEAAAAVSAKQSPCAA